MSSVKWWPFCLCLDALRYFCGCYQSPKISPSAQFEAVATLIPKRTRDAIITPLLHQNDVATSFWRYNDVVIASCARWVAMRPPEGDPVLTDGWRLRWRHAARRPDWGIPSRSTTTTTQDVWKQENKQRVLMHGHQGWNVRHGLCHIYMIYVYILSCL